MFSSYVRESSTTALVDVWTNLAPKEMLETRVYQIAVPLTMNRAEAKSIPQFRIVCTQLLAILLLVRLLQAINLPYDIAEVSTGS
jgi:hypothetical protein